MKRSILLGFLAMFLTLNVAFGQTNYYYHDCNGNLIHIYDTPNPDYEGTTLRATLQNSRIMLSGVVCGELVIDGASVMYNGKQVSPCGIGALGGMDYIGDITVLPGSSMTIRNWAPHPSSPIATGSIKVLGTLNVNNSTISGNATSGQDFKNIQIGDASNVGTATMTNTKIRRLGNGGSHALYVENGSLSLTNCTADSIATGAAAVYMANRSTNSLTINGGSYKATNYTLAVAGGTANISNATFTATGSSGFEFTGGAVTATGITVTSAGTNSIAATISGGNHSISGSNITSYGTSAQATGVAVTNGSVTLSSTTITGESQIAANGGNITLNNCQLNAVAANGQNGNGIIFNNANSNVTVNNTVFNSINYPVIYSAPGNLNFGTGNQFISSSGKTIIPLKFTTVSNNCILPKLPFDYKTESAINITSTGALTFAAGSNVDLAGMITVRGTFNANGNANNRVALNKTSTGNIFEVTEGGKLNLNYSDINALSGIRTNLGTTTLTNSTLKTTAGNGLIIGNEDTEIFLVSSSVVASGIDVQYLAGGDIEFDSASSLSGSNASYTFEFSTLNSEMDLVLMPKPIVVPNNFTVNTNGIWNIAPGNTFNTGLIRISGTVNAPSSAGSQTNFYSTAGMFNVLAGGSLNASNLLVNSVGNALDMNGGTATVDNCIFNISAGNGIVLNGSGSATISNTDFSLASAYFPVIYAGAGSLYWGTGNNISGGRNHAQVNFNSLAANMYLPKFPLPFVFTTGSNFTVTSAGKLEIASGNIIKFANWFNVQGTFKAEAKTDETILFTSANDDNAGGDTNNGTPDVPAVGSWGGIIFDGATSSASSIKGSELRFGGKGNRGIIVVDNQATPTIESCELKNSYYGFELQRGAKPTLITNTIAASQVVPLAMTLDSDPVMQNNVFSASDNQYDAIGILGGTLTYDAHIIKRDFSNIPNVTYLLLGNVENPANKTLTIDPGIVIKAKAASDHIRNFGTLKAVGTESEKIIFTSVHDDSYGNPADTGSDGNTGIPAIGNWSGIYFGNTSTSASTLDYCVVNYARNNNVGSTYNGAAITMQNASPTIRNTTVSISDYGIAAIQASNPIVENVEFINCTSTPVAMSITANPTFSNITFTNNTGYHAIGIFGETVGVSGKLTKRSLAGYPNIVYAMLDIMTISAGTNVEIEEGIVMKFIGRGSNYNNHYNIRTLGGLKIAGTEANPVVFTSIKDDHLYDTNKDGNQSAPAKGDWGSIVYDSTTDENFSSVDWAILRYGGQDAGSDNCGNISIVDANIKVSNTVLSNSGNYGIWLEGTASPDLSNNVTIEGAGKDPMAMSLTANPVMNVNSPTFSGCATSGIFIYPQTVSSDITLSKRAVSGMNNVPYLLQGNTYNPLKVAEGATFSIDPGIILKAKTNSGMANSVIIVDGALNAVGTAAEPIIFTSILDDSKGGDTNNNGTSTTPTKGSWRGILFNASGLQDKNQLKYCEFSYGGSSSYVDDQGVIAIESTKVNIENCKFENVAGCGLRIRGTASPVIKNSEFTNIEYTPIFLSMFSNPDIATGNTMTNCGFLGLGVIPETYTSNATIPIRSFAGYNNITYIMFNNFGYSTINAGAELIIPAGVVFKHNSHSSSYNSAAMFFNVNGKLTIKGTAENPVVFTNYDDDNYGNPADTRNNGAIAVDYGNTNISRNEGHCAINFQDVSDDASTIDHAIFASFSKGILLNSASPTITNTRFEKSFYGVRLQGSSAPKINSCQFNDLFNVPVMQSIVSNVVTTDSPAAWSNSLSGTTWKAIGIIDNELTQSYTLQKRNFAGIENIPYYFGTQNFNIGTSSVLTIESGVVCKFANNIGMIVKRGLMAEGGLLPSEKVIFTHIEDDFYGGDANSNGNVASTSKWAGIIFENTAVPTSCIINNSIIRNAGHTTNYGAIRADGSNPKVTNSTIYDCLNGVVSIASSNPVINNCDIYNITNYAVNNVNKAFTIDASNNWWGDNSGPKHSGNPEGTGTTVSDMVNYSPFITTGTANPIMGDVSLNGLVQAYDASLVLQHTVGNIALAGMQLVVGDVSGDGTIGAMDASLILMYVAGTNSSFPNMVGAMMPEGELALEAGEIVYNNKQISVPFNLINAHNIRSVEWTAAYDTRVLRPISVEGCSGAMSAYRIDELNGEIRFAMARENVVSGNVNLVNVVFEVLSNDETSIITSNALKIDETDHSNIAQAIELKIAKAPTGISDKFANVELEVKQIDSKLEIRFNNSRSENLQISLCDLNGRILATRAVSTDNATIDMPNVSGVYVVRLSGGNTNVTKKIVVR